MKRCCKASQGARTCAGATTVSKSRPGPAGVHARAARPDVIAQPRHHPRTGIAGRRVFPQRDRCRRRPLRGTCADEPLQGAGAALVRQAGDAARFMAPAFTRRTSKDRNPAHTNGAALIQATHPSLTTPASETLNHHNDQEKRTHPSNKRAIRRDDYGQPPNS